MHLDILLSRNPLIQDYVGDDVTPDNFLKVLTGDAEGMKGIGSGKVSIFGEVHLKNSD